MHPGGPYWARKDDGWWSIPKGEVDEGEDTFSAAVREFTEELGVPAPSATPVALGEIVQAGGKRVEAWAVEGDVDLDTVSPGTFEMEWPPRSGATKSFPEVDRALWCSTDEARTKLLAGQVPFLDRLLDALGDARLGQTPGEGGRGLPGPTGLGRVGPSR